MARRAAAKLLVATETFSTEVGGHEVIVCTPT